jgi:hypothetical protein
MLTDDPKCPACGKARSEWRVNNSLGATKNGKTYCCEGCSDGGKCTCDLLQTAPRPLRNVDPTADSE